MSKGSHVCCGLTWWLVLKHLKVISYIGTHANLSTNLKVKANQSWLPHTRRPGLPPLPSAWNCVNRVSILSICDRPDSVLWLAWNRSTCQIVLKHKENKVLQHILFPYSGAIVNSCIIYDRFVRGGVGYFFNFKRSDCYKRTHLIKDPCLVELV